MSLRTFHLVFLAISIMFDVYFTAWAVKEYRLQHESSSFVLAAGSILTTILLLLYGRWFLRKIGGVKLQ